MRGGEENPPLSHIHMSGLCAVMCSFSGLCGEKKEGKKQHCHQSSGSDMVSGVGGEDEDGKGEREREG